jgi:TRAP-type mannitol/chloroaromatic compound transport system permease small subunit
VARIRNVLHIIDTINEWVGRAVSVLVWPVVFLLGTEVTLRYVFNKPTLWAMPLSLYAFGTIAIVAGGYVLLHKEHVVVDVLYSRYSPRVKAGLDVFTAFFFFLFCGALLWKGIEFAQTSVIAGEKYTGVWQPIIWPIKLMLPFGALLIVLQGLAKLTRDLVLLLTGRSLTEE